MKNFVFFLIFIFIVFSCRNKENIAQNNSEKINKSTTIDETSQQKTEEVMYVNSFEGLRVRKEPGLDSERLFLLNNNEKVIVLEKDTNIYTIDGINGNWFLIKADGIIGWVFSGYLVSEEELITKNAEINNLTSKIIIPFSIEELNALPSLWQIKTEDSKYLIEDRGTAPPPRFVIVKNLENEEIIFFGTYFQNINLREYTIEIVKNYGTYYAGKWSINKNLVDNEIDFGKVFLKENEPPLEWVEIADLAQGNGLGLLIIFEYNFKTKESKIIGGKYYRTM
jgi:hypothetical protein